MLSKDLINSFYSDLVPLPKEKNFCTLKGNLNVFILILCLDGYSLLKKEIISLIATQFSNIYYLQKMIDLGVIEVVIYNLFDPVLTTEILELLVTIEKIDKHFNGMTMFDPQGTLFSRFFPTSLVTLLYSD